MYILVMNFLLQTVLKLTSIFFFPFFSCYLTFGLKYYLLFSIIKNKVNNLYSVFYMASPLCLHFLYLYYVDIAREYSYYICMLLCYSHHFMWLIQVNIYFKLTVILFSALFQSFVCLKNLSLVDSSGSTHENNEF